MATGSSILAWRIPWTEGPGHKRVHGWAHRWRASWAPSATPGLQDRKQGVWKDELQRGLSRSLRFSSVSEGSPLRSVASRPGPRPPTSRTADQNQKGGWETG